MTIAHKCIKRLSLVLLFGVALGILVGCGEKSDVVLGPIDQPNVEVFTWIWAVDDDLDSLRVYDADTGRLAASFGAFSHYLMRETKAGPVGEPTVWLGANGQANGFTQGFAAHGDHSHMTAPVRVAQLDLGLNSAHTGVSHDGSTVAWANDGGSDFTLVDTETLVPKTLPGGSAHSAALPCASGLIATDMHQKWVRVLDLEDGTVLHEAVIDTLSHGDAWHEASATAFLACLHGFEVFDPQLGQTETFIPYPGPGRTNFLFHRGDNSVALGPVKGQEPLGNSIFLLDMAACTASEIVIAGASLTWNRGSGNFSISDDGKLSAVTDTNEAKAYLINLYSSTPAQVASVVMLDIPAPNMACALDYGGNYLWLLNTDTGMVDGFCTTDLVSEYQLQVDISTDYIFTTSVNPAIAIIKD